MISFSTILLAVRGLRRHRRANATIVATLAVLAGVLIATLSLGYNLLLSPWTYDTERFGVLRHGVAGSTQERYGFAADEYRAIRDTGLFEALVASQGMAVAFGDGHGAARSLQMVRTTPDALAVSDSQPLLGRFVQAGEHGDERRVAISHELWQSDFGGRSDILGESLLLDGQRHEIVGVMPPRFHFMGGDFWTAHVDDPAIDTGLAARLVLNFKLRAGTDMDDVAGTLASMATGLAERGEAGRYPRGWRITPLRVIDAVTGPQRPAILLVLSGAASLLLLGVLNVAALLVARQIADAGLVATRLALGESRAQSIAVAFIESLLIAALSLAGAWLLGRLLFDQFVGAIALEWVPRELEGAFRYTTPALWTLPLIALIIAVVLTVFRLPGLLRIDARAVMAGSQRSGGRRGDLGASRWLSGLQISIATAILVSSFAIGAGAQSLAERDLGFDMSSTQHSVLIFPRERYADGAQRMAALDRFADAMRREGAAAVGYTDSAPLQRYTRAGWLSASSASALDDPVPIDFHVAHGDLAGALELRLREGRFVDDRADRADTEPVAVITQALARQLTPEGSALGITITAAGGADPAIARRVVGVVDDILHESPLATTRPTVYVPYAQDATAFANPGGQVAALVRWQSGAGDRAARGAERFHAVLGSVDPWIAVREITTMEQRATRTVAGVTLARQLFAGFSLLGVLLATLGIAAVAALAVARQRHAIAVRSAIGATPRHLLSTVLSGSLRVALPATLVGSALGWLLVGVLQAALQDSAVLRGDHMLMGPALLLVCALLATLLPARTAARVQPLVLLQRS
jgi:predicted permease